MQETNVLLSVIIPVYKTERYLERCVQSVQNNAQDSGANVEIILIDDGSPDESGAICDSLADAYENVVCKHIENGGVSNARNTGMALATGKYICFLDSDDFWVENGNFHKLVDVLQSSEYEVIVNGYYLADERGELVRTLAQSEEESKGGYSAITKFAYGEYCICSIYISNDFRREYGILFDASLQYYEDKQFSYICSWCTDKIKRINAPFFAYCYNPTSAMHKSRTMEDYLEEQRKLNVGVLKLTQLPSLKSIPEENEKVEKLFERLAVGHIMEIIVGYCRTSTKLEQLNEWLEQNHFMSYVKNYREYELGEAVAAQFKAYNETPARFARAIRFKWRLRCLAVKLLPRKVVHKLRK